MRIAIVTHTYPLNPQAPEGIAGIFIPPFAYEMRRRGHHVFAFVPDRQGEKVPDEKVPVTWFDWMGGDKPLGLLNPLNPLDYLKLGSLFVNGRRALRRFVAERGIDVCLAMSALPGGVLAGWAKRDAGTPYAVWCLGSDVYVSARLPILRQMIARALRHADRLYADGLDLCRRVEALSGQRCAFLPTVRPLPPADECRVELDGDRVNFLFLGRLERVKGIDVLLEAVRLLKADGVAARLHVIGSGSLQGWLRQQIAEYGLEADVSLLGYRADADVAAYLRACDYLVIPSRSESLPLVFSEAMRTGTPIVATDVGDLGPMVGGNGVGLVVPPEDPVRLKEALARAAAERGSGRYREKMAELARQFDLRSTVATCLADLQAVVAP